MTYPFIPSVEYIATYFINALKRAKCNKQPYKTFSISEVLPEDVCTAILVLPIVPPMLGDTDGTRDTYNKTRTFFTPKLRKQFPVCENLSQALQCGEVVAQLEKTLGITAEGSHVRIEYMQDTNGMWLEPHRDVPDKLFSMVIYLCTGPEVEKWGTDIYDHKKQWIKKTNAEFNSAVVFKAGKYTWHGFELCVISGVRRLMEINYVRNWRSREQLAFPEKPVSCAANKLGLRVSKTGE